MNINPKTGKIWLNNYLQMYGTIFANKNNKYIELSRYYDLIGKLEGRTKTVYAMLLHSHIAGVICNRSPGMHLNIFMYIDNRKGIISNSKDMKKWILSTDWMNCNGKHLLDIASADVWWIVYKSMIDVGLLSTTAGVLRVMIPINGRFLPLPYAYVAFLSRVKKDSELTKLISKTIAETPDKMRTSLKDTPKEDLIDEIVRMKTKDLTLSKNSEVFKMLHEEISNKFPHKWGNNLENKVQKNRENFLENISEKIIENKVENNLENNVKNNSENIPGFKTAEEIVELIPENISKDKSNKKSKKDSIIVKELPVENISDFVSNKLSRSKPSISSPPRTSGTNTESESLEASLFFADEVTANDSEKALKAEMQEINDEINSENNPEEISEILDLPTQQYDIFGLLIEEEGIDLQEIPEHITDNKNMQDDMDEFWN